MNLAEARTILTIICTAFDREPPNGLDVIWAETMADIPFNLGKAAALDLIRNSQFMPKVADIRSKAHQIGRERQRELREAEERKALTAYAAEAGPLTDRRPEIRQFVGQVRSVLPDGDREVLHPRAVAWEREHRAFQRQQHAEPNPEYDPGMQPVPEWGRSKSGPTGCWWQDDAARERHAKELLADSGRLAGRRPEH